MDQSYHAYPGVTSKLLRNSRPKSEINVGHAAQRQYANLTQQLRFVRTNAESTIRVTKATVDRKLVDVKTFLIY